MQNRNTSALKDLDREVGIDDLSSADRKSLALFLFTELVLVERLVLRFPALASTLAL